MTFYKPSAEELEPLRKEAFQAGLSEAEWLAKMSATIAKIFIHNPKQYRGLGPYWWVVKKVLLDHGYDFGDFIDAEWYEKVTYGSDVLNILASYSYQVYTANLGLIESNEHTLAMIDDEGAIQNFTYVLIDDDMESRIV